MRSLLEHLSHRYPYRQVASVCLPLVLSMSATTAMEFTDRAFLSNYSLEAISAAVPGSITAYLFISFFAGVGGYAGVFIAQYYGRGESESIGKVLWQAIWFCCFSGVFFWLLALFATEPIFRFADHATEVQELEKIYFSILVKGAVLHVASNTLATFFTGRGITRPVMVITFCSVLCNIPLDYALIYGRWGLPELGIAGAGMATVSSWGMSCLLLVPLIFSQKNIKRFNLFGAIRPDTKLFIRLLRYGVPGSLQFTLDILAFTSFILLVGRLGTLELAITNIVLSISALAFMPTMGVSQGVSVLVGQALGRGEPDIASKSVWGSIHLLLLYIVVLDIAFFLFPEKVLTPFILSVAPGDASQLIPMGTILLRIIAAYLFMDALYMTFSGALRGAGDTRFLMITTGITALLVLLLPVYLGIMVFQITLYQAWLFLLGFIGTMFLLSGGRYGLGKWRSMLVIEHSHNQPD